MDEKRTRREGKLEIGRSAMTEMEKAIGHMTCV